MYGDSLMALVKAAPNLQQLSLYCGSRDCSSVPGSLMLDIAQACPHLRTFSCTEMHLDHFDDCLKPFLAICSGIVNLDLQVHDRLTDTMLIEALNELKSLHSLNLQGCCKLTDQTLHFLAQRFSSTLKVLYLDCINWNLVRYYGELTEQGKYTPAGIASLRAQCTKLHTYHYMIHADARLQRKLIAEASPNATIVELIDVQLLPM
eukprot:gene9451-11120_t